jgi:hypothetical protein
MRRSIRRFADIFIVPNTVPTLALAPGWRWPMALEQMPILPSL